MERDSRDGDRAGGRRCREAGVRLSMGSVGDCYDNAMCEIFFATQECALLASARLPTHAADRLALFEFVEGRYNLRRRHSDIDYLSPINYEGRLHLRAADRATLSAA